MVRKAPGSDPRGRAARSARGRRTCLHCYLPFRVERGRETCPRCGFEQSKQEQEQYWTREDRFIRIERACKVGAILATLGVAGVLVQVMDAASLPWGVGLLAAVGGLLWYTAGGVTRRSAFMDLRFLWPPLLLCIAFGPMVFAALLRWVGGAEASKSEAGAWQAGLVWALPWLPVLAASLVLPRIFGRLRRERLEAGEEAGAMASELDFASEE